MSLTEAGRTSLLTELGSKAGAVDKSKADTRQRQDALDKAVLKAKQRGVKYREIADACGRSVAWVQATLNRLGYVGERTKKRLADEKETSSASA